MTEHHLRDEISILDPTNVTLERDSFGDMVLTLPDKSYEKVQAMRAFPLSFPDRYIVLRTKDEEIGILEETKKLARSTRSVLQEELRKAYFIPVITKIISLDENYGASKWKVETDHGTREFDVRTRDDVKPEPPFRILFRDADGNRYEIPDYRRLDKKSQLLLDSET